MLKIENLTVMFDDQVPVVDSVSLSLEAEKTTVIIGESGSGKSITISAILGILPKEAKITGSIKLDNKELLTMSENEMNKLRGSVLGYVPQGGGNSMNPLMSVGDQVAEPMLIHKKMPKSKAFEKAIEWLDKMELRPAEKLAKAYPHTLSGGMRQRALLAMGAAGGAKILLADEPTKGLDDKRISQIENLFASLKETAILCVTHDLRFAKKIADTICVMYGGKMVEIADAKSFFDNPMHPYSQMLIAALPENGLNCTDDYTPSFEKRAGCSFHNRCPQKDIACLKDIKLSSQGKHKVRCRFYATADQ